MGLFRLAVAMLAADIDRAEGSINAAHEGSVHPSNSKIPAIRSEPIMSTFMITQQDYLFLVKAYS